MTARQLYTSGRHLQVSGEGYGTAGEISGNAGVPDLQALLMPIALCNESQLRSGQVIGDPMEGALLAGNNTTGGSPRFRLKRNTSSRLLSILMASKCG